MNGQGLQAACEELGKIAARIHDLKRDRSQADRRKNDAMMEGQLSDREVRAEQLKAAKIIQALDLGPDFVSLLADLKKK